MADDVIRRYYRLGVKIAFDATIKINLSAHISNVKIASYTVCRVKPGGPNCTILSADDKARVLNQYVLNWSCFVCLCDGLFRLYGR